MKRPIISLLAVGIVLAPLLKPREHVNRPATFTALVFTSGRLSRFPDGTRIVEMTCEGELRRSLPLKQRLVDIVKLPDGSAYYALGSHQVYHVDARTLAVTPMRIAGAGFTDVSWQIGVTYDTRRDRIVVATLGGEGFLYAYERRSGTWSLMRSLANVDLEAIVYRPADDMIYGLPVSRDGAIRYIRKYDAEGCLVASPPLSRPLTSAESPPRDFQMTLASDGRLAIISPPVPTPFTVHDPAGRPSPYSNSLYIVNPDSGVIEYEGPLRAH